MGQLVPDFLTALPQCPSVEMDTYRVVFGRRAGYGDPQDEDYYYIECVGTGHESVSVARNYPAYDGIHGLIERP